MRVLPKPLGTLRRSANYKMGPQSQSALAPVHCLRAFDTMPPVEEDARTCLERAFLKTYRWPQNFLGFTAALLVRTLTLQNHQVLCKD